MSQIKAIETLYNGYRFRSRLEARWAVFFNTAGIKYQYEPEGFDLGNGVYYLPDFWLPELKMWVEVKGEKPSEEDQQKCATLAEQSGNRVLIVGQIPQIGYGNQIENEEFYFGCMQEIFGDENGNKSVVWDRPYFFCQCTFCSEMGCEFDGRSVRINCCNENNESKANKLYNATTPLLVNAYKKAKQSRFEHGEKP